MDEKAIVLFSGGQDSATCLAWALNEFPSVETIGFDYGQNHTVELEVRQTFLKSLRSSFPDLTKNLGEDHLVDLSVLGAISDTALTGEREIEMNEAGLPNTFVPGRNLLFLRSRQLSATGAMQSTSSAECVKLTTPVILIAAMTH